MLKKFLIILFVYTIQHCEHQKTFIKENISCQSLEKSSIEWNHPSEKSNGVVLLVHGLNLKPEKMKPIGSIFLEKGTTTVTLSLSGHRQIAGEWAHVTRQIWLSELLSALCEVKEFSTKHNVPIYYVGYSIGALLLMDLNVSTQPEIPLFKHTFLFSPAIRLKYFTKLVKVFNILGSSFELFSKNNKEYRANSGTSMQAYNVLFETYDHWRKEEHLLFNKKSLDSFPTTIFMDPRDELVDFSDIKAMTLEPNYKNWSIEETPVEIGNFYHLAIDESQLGEKSWEKIKKIIQKNF